MRVSETIGTYLGWCPRCRSDAAAPVTPPVMKRDDTRQQPQPLRNWVTVPSGFTALSLAILFATCFVGGQEWWPACVLGITVAGMVAMAARPGRGCAG